MDGEDYFFLTPEEFRDRVSLGHFVEWEEIYGNLYGTLQSEVDAALRQGNHLLFDVDVKGALSIKRAYPEACLIFIRPPREVRNKGPGPSDGDAKGRLGSTGGTRRRRCSALVVTMPDESN
jgi:guanylate kinase